MHSIILSGTVPNPSSIIAKGNARLIREVDSPQHLSHPRDFRTEISAINKMPRDQYVIILQRLIFESQALAKNNDRRARYRRTELLLDFPTQLDTRD
jgi:hypothetical protein